MKKGWMDGLSHTSLDQEIYVRCWEVSVVVRCRSFELESSDWEMECVHFERTRPPLDSCSFFREKTRVITTTRNWGKENITHIPVFLFLGSFFFDPNCRCHLVDRSYANEKRGKEHKIQSKWGDNLPDDERDGWRVDGWMERMSMYLVTD